MKPIRLNFCGLQSYRQPQEINFDELGIMGFFGVFGPTGGGKSTILDAISLALFGKVERATRGTQGIINDLETKVSVGFEFALGDDVFRVERLYERDKKDKDSVKNSNARLIKLSEGSAVVADKISEVDLRIVELLGMSMEDFSRAVVLPQGKFDQFLKLTGGERAKMLEHIFLLEQYGENLYRKAAGLEENLKKELDTTERLIQQLGEASEDAVSLVNQKLVQAKVEVQVQSKVLNLAQLQMNKAENAKKVYEELQKSETELRSLKQKEAEIEESREKLLQADKAEPYRAFLVQLADLTNKEKAERLQLDLLNQAEITLKAKALVALEELTKAKNQEPELSKLRNTCLPNAKIALATENQYQQVLQQLQEMNKKIAATTVEMHTVEADGKKKNYALQVLKVRRDELQNNIKRITALLSFRTEIDNTFVILRDCEIRSLHEQEILKNLQLKEVSLKHKEEELRQHLLVEIEGSDNVTLSQLMASAPKFIETLENKRKAFLVEVERIIDLDRAGTLAAHLVVGQPCLVCGSIDHPKPNVADINNEELTKAKNGLEQTELRLNAVRSWYNQAVNAYSLIQNLSIEIKENLRPSWQAKNTELTSFQASLKQQYEDLANKLNTLDLSSKLVITEDIFEITSQLKIFQKDKESADQSLSPLIGETNQLDQKIAVTETEVSDLRAKYREQQAANSGFSEQAKQMEAQMAVLQTSISEITGGLPALEFDKMTEQKISQLEKQIQEAQQDWDKAKQAELEIVQSKSNLLAVIHTIKEHLTETQRKIDGGIAILGFTENDQIAELLLDSSIKGEMKAALEDYDRKRASVLEAIQQNQQKLQGESFSEQEYLTLLASFNNAKLDFESSVKAEGALQNNLAEITEKNSKWKLLNKDKERLGKRKELSSKIISLIKGRKFVQFLAEEHLADMTVEASMRLGTLTGQRYALELDDGFNFILRDEYSGGLRRPVSSLSGGETFLTSLSMALALSSKIQLKGKYPLGFFFLDEGFGTLDPDKLELVMNTLEHLYDGHRMVGIITHVQELKNRMPRYLEVTSANLDGEGSTVIMK